MLRDLARAHTARKPTETFCPVSPRRRFRLLAKKKIDPAAFKAILAVRAVVWPCVLACLAPLLACLGASARPDAPLTCLHSKRSRS